jgi:hypothetical protein
MLFMVGMVLPAGDAGPLSSEIVREAGVARRAGATVRAPIGPSERIAPSAPPPGTTPVLAGFFRVVLFG